MKLKPGLNGIRSAVFGFGELWFEVSGLRDLWISGSLGFLGDSELSPLGGTSSGARRIHASAVLPRMIRRRPRQGRRCAGPSRCRWDFALVSPHLDSATPRSRNPKPFRIRQGGGGDWEKHGGLNKTRKHLKPCAPDGRQSDKSKEERDLRIQQMQFKSLYLCVCSDPCLILYISLSLSLSLSVSLSLSLFLSLFSLALSRSLSLSLSLSPPTSVALSLSLSLC